MLPSNGKEVGKKKSPPAARRERKMLTWWPNLKNRIIRQGTGLQRRSFWAARAKRKKKTKAEKFHKAKIPKKKNEAGKKKKDR